MIYLYPVGDSFVVYGDKEFVPPELMWDIIELEKLPEGSGILKRREDGTFYFENNEPSEPLPEVPQETIEEKLARMEKQLEAQQQQSLTILDVNLTLYEEVLTLREEIAALKGTGNV